MRLNVRLSQKGLILIAVPLIFELFSFAWLYTALKNAEQEIRKETYAKDVQKHMNNITQLVIGASSSLIYYRSTMDRAFLARYKRTIGEIQVEFQELKETQKDSPAELEALKPLKEAVDRAVMYMEESRRSFETGDNARQMEFITSWKNYLRHLSDEMEKVSVRYKRLADTAPELEEYRRELLKRLVLLAIVASIVLAAGLAFYFNRDTTGRLKVLMENTRRFAKGEPLVRTLEGSDEIAELDDVFHQMADTITEQARQKQEFVAMITHDMRSPLMAVVNLLAGLTAGVYGEEVSGRTREIIERSEGNLNRIIRLINDLLDAEKLAAGKMDMHFDHVKVADLLDISVQAIRSLAEQKKVSFDLPPVDFQIYADGDRLVQVIINILSNALKFSPEGGKIIVSARSDGDWLEMRFSDQGPGIPAGEREKIFQRFQQLRSTSVRVKGGTGLGLAICKDIIEQHSGIIGVESEEGKGSTFWFRIPSTSEAMVAASKSP